MALLSLRDVSIGFGGRLVLENISLQIERGERLGLVGRNGAGKSTLLKLIAADLAPDDGIIARERGVRVAYLPQEVPEGLSGSVGDIIAAGMRVSEDARAEGDAWRGRLLMDTILARTGLDPAWQFADLSAGIKRRVMLARELAPDPEIVLLDEPTNHLDLDAIAWMEDFLARYTGTLVFVTHDRAFLRRLATRIIEVDRGRLIDWACDYDTFTGRKQAVLSAEATQQTEFDKKLAQEEAWIRQGIEARRTRNEGRVRALERMRRQRSERRDGPGAVRMALQEAERSGKLIIEAKSVGFGYEGNATEGARPVVSGFSTTILRGDKLGIVGPNGAGKTTLLRLLLGHLAPDSGSVRLGSNVEVAYFDQLRSQLDPDRTVFDNVAGGRDFITVNGLRRHVLGYLQEFLFPPERARAYVSTLSGGERNRLLLARLFARPANVLALDEPTNDLDLETLELLEDLLLNFEGTLLLVTHDRELLNNVVDGTLALEPGGRVGQYAGGYDDWLRQRPGADPKPVVPDKPSSAAARAVEKPRAAKLTYKERQELDALPAAIESFESEQAQLYAEMADPAVYQSGPDEVTRRTARLTEVERLLSELYSRWEELEDRNSGQSV
jgi:ABC transport system ATP-binding/permease protein